MGTDQAYVQRICWRSSSNVGFGSAIVGSVEDFGVKMKASVLSVVVVPAKVRERPFSTQFVSVVGDEVSVEVKSKNSKLNSSSFLRQRNTECFHVSDFDRLEFHVSDDNKHRPAAIQQAKKNSPRWQADEALSANFLSKKHSPSEIRPVTKHGLTRLPSLRHVFHLLPDLAGKQVFRAGEHELEGLCTYLLQIFRHEDRFARRQVPACQHRRRLRYPRAVLDLLRAQRRRNAEDVLRSGVENVDRAEVLLDGAREELHGVGWWSGGRESAIGVHEACDGSEMYQGSAVAVWRSYLAAWRLP